MRSWVFRHRARLRVIYGVPPVPLPRARPGGPAAEPGGDREEDGADAGDGPGTVQRRSRWVVLRPMRRAG